MSRDDALDHPQAIQHWPLCGVSGFPPEAIAMVALSMTVRLALFIHRPTHSRRVAATIDCGGDIIEPEITAHRDIPSRRR
jgi:hypothetical protein